MSVASSNRLLFAAGAFSALLGIAVMIGWYAHLLPLLQIVPGDALMERNSAAGFALCGFACLFLSCHWNIPARFTSCVGALLGGSALLQPLLKSRSSLYPLFYHASSTGVGHAGHLAYNLSLSPHMSYTSATCLLLSGLALLIFAGNRPGYRQPFTSAAMGAAVLALVIASLMEYFLSVTKATGGSRLFEMPLHAAAGFLMLGLGILHASWRVWSRRVYGPRVEGSFLPPLLLRPWAPVMMTLIAASLSLLIWRALVIKQNAEIRRSVSLEAAKTEDALQSQITARATALERFSRQWDIYGTPTEDQWHRECVLLARDLPGWQELTMVDPAGHIVWAYPSSASYKLFGYDVFADPKRGATYLKAQKTGDVFVTPQISLLMGGKGFVVVAPIVQNGKPRGYVSGVFRSATAFDAMVGANMIRDYAVAIDEGPSTELLWSRTLPRSANTLLKAATGPYASPRLDAWEQTRAITAYGLHWRLRVRPTASFFEEEQSSLPAVALILGLLLAGMVGATLHFAQAARRHAEHMGSANERLEREVSDRKIHLQQIEFERQRALQGWNEAKRQSALLANQAQELKRSNESLSEFASIASHDLKEPLRKIQTFGDMLRRRSSAQLDSDASGYLDRMTGAAQRMQTLIDGLLAYSRTSARPPEMVAVDLNEVVQGVLSDLEMRVTESDAWVIRGPLPIIEADPVQMRQLFQNLLGNALKFRRPNVPAQVRLTGVVHGGVVRITLSDNGIGFEPRFADRIFRIFERLESPQHFEGTGVGLAICRTIVDRHHGTICASATPAEGATFTIELPGVITAPIESVTEAIPA